MQNDLQVINIQLSYTATVLVHSKYCNDGWPDVYNWLQLPAINNSCRLL